MTSALFQPTAIRGLELANRFVRSATWEGLADERGCVASRPYRPTLWFYRHTGRRSWEHGSG